MAKSKKKKKAKKKTHHPLAHTGSRSKGKRKPSAKAKAAYNKLIVRSYHRLRATLKKHNPAALKGE